MDPANILLILNELYLGPKQTNSAQAELAGNGRRQSSSQEVQEALQLAGDPQIRQYLCDLAGDLHMRGAIAPLVAALDDPSDNVRSSAVDALAKIGDPVVGPELLQHLRRENSPEVRRLLTLSMGRLAQREAIPELITTLNEADAALRASAAWALGVLGAGEALPALTRALDDEQSPYTRAQIEGALRTLGSF